MHTESQREMQRPTGRKSELEKTPMRSEAVSCLTSRPPLAAPIISYFDWSWREGGQLEKLSAGSLLHHK